MPSDDSRSDLLLAAFVVVGLTLWRLGTLAFDGTDLFMDEAQYWLWGQHLDWGYYSKPPMIAFVSHAVTGIAGSDSVFWVRAPGSVLHAITAVLTGLASARLFGTRVGAWTAVLYVSLPFVTLGSWLFSTDTILLPFFALAVLALVHLSERRSLGWAVVLGIAAGCGFLSKYAMLYLPLMAGLAAVFVPRARIAWRDAGVAAAVTLVVAAPNILWNIRNGGTTVRHVALENAEIGQSRADLGRGLEFLAGQFGVFGPVLFALLLVALWKAVRGRAAPEVRWLLFLSLPVVALMTVQAIRSHAYANWAVTGYVAGTILAASMLVPALPRLKWVSFAVHLALAVGFPLLYVFPHAIHLPNGKLLAARYLGQGDLSREIAATAREAGIGTIVAGDRKVLADLFYTLHGEDLTLAATPPRGGRVRNYYEQSFALPADAKGPFLFVHAGGPVACPDGPAETLRVIAPETGAYRGQSIRLDRITEACSKIWRQE